MKKKKMKLSELKVESFITRTEEQKSKTIKGGFTIRNICNPPGDVHTINDYSCAIGGTCGSSRCYSWGQQTCNGGPC